MPRSRSQKPSAPTDWRSQPVALYLAIAGKAIAAWLWAFTSYRAAAGWFFFSPDVFVLRALFVPSAQGLCRVHQRFATEHSEIWLTIDDGPDEEDTPRLLDLLDQHGARATFFVVGEKVARWPHLVTEIRRRGHEIGHHTHTHPGGTFWCASPFRIATELDQPLDLLAQLGLKPRWFRAPVGIKNLLLAPALKARGLHYVGWSIRSGDCRARTPDEVVNKVVNRLQPGAIVLLHEGPSAPRAIRVTAIGRLLEELGRRNFKCVIPHPTQLL